MVCEGLNKQANHSFKWVVDDESVLRHDLEQSVQLPGVCMYSGITRKCLLVERTKWRIKASPPLSDIGVIWMMQKLEKVKDCSSLAVRAVEQHELMV